MPTLPQDSVQISTAMTIAVAATFTAEPLEESLNFWIKQLNWLGTAEFAPYNQIFQQLLDPTSLLSQNQQGANVILLRFEDWSRDLPREDASTQAAIERNLDEFIVALQAATARSTSPYLLCLCPSSPAAEADPHWRAFTQSWQAKLEAELGGCSNLHWIRSEDLARYPVADYYDAQRDRLGHIPFTPLFYTALATAIIRKLYTIKSAPHKVIVLDCDNTIWRGIVGEDGVSGIEITPAYQALQQFMIAQQAAGMLLCFCSKNNEADVLEVFEQRPEMPLKLEHIVAWRINWLPKSQNIRSLAQELNLGLDSFIFLDDNPVECAEVRTHCPEVLTLQLPIQGNIPQFLQHVWAFDHLKVTAEDQQRTLLYKQNLERERFQQQTLTIDAFLAGLDLQVEIAEPDAAQLPRIAQLTQRTNQFNFTTVRRSDSQIQQLAAAGLECRAVTVRDRFGDYGLVGVMIFGREQAALRIDTFLLSCRVLGRGVEHQMMQHLGKIAEERELTWVQADFIPSKKNLPARNFLERIAADYRQPIETGDRYEMPVSVAAALVYQPASEPTPAAVDGAPQQPQKQPQTSTQPGATISKSDYLGKIATQWYQPTLVLAAISSGRSFQQRSSQRPYVAPRTLTEADLAKLWAELLQVESVGVTDDYFDLGGTSLLSVELFAQIEQQFGKKLPLTALVSAPTVEQLAQVLNQSEAMDSLVQLRVGGDQPPVFLVHDGDGETLLYRNLANRLNPAHPVYGLQPHSRSDAAMLHTRIPDMAAYYIKKIRSVQPQGPYLIGGMCAGGVITFEIAQQLQLQGETVAMVALLDAADVATPKRIGRVAEQRLKRFSSVFAEQQQLNPLQKVGVIALKVSQKVSNLLVYETQSRFLQLQHKIQLRLLRSYLDRGQAIPSFLQPLSVRQIYEFAEQDYIPSQFDGEVFLVRATQGSGTDEPWIEVYSDPLLGWEQRVTAGVIVQDVPGGHSSMLQEPNVAILADAMQAYIDRQLALLASSNSTQLPTMIA
jgi:FkbH-like protein